MMFVCYNYFQDSGFRIHDPGSGSRGECPGAFFYFIEAEFGYAELSG